LINLIWYIWNSKNKIIEKIIINGFIKVEKIKENNDLDNNFKENINKIKILDKNIDYFEKEYDLNKGVLDEFGDN